MLLSLAQQQAGSIATRHCFSPTVVRPTAILRRAAASAEAGSRAHAQGMQVEEEHQQSLPHVSVLLQEVLQNLNHIPIKVYVDCTLGAGGHMAAMIQQHQELEMCVGIDVDPTAHAIAAARLASVTGGPGQPQLHLMRGNYCEVTQLLSSCPAGSLVGQVDAMLMDLGVSSMQIDSSERGFSFMSDGPIDMRMDPNAAISAEQLVNSAPEAELGRILRDYGEEKSWKAVARRIVAAREAAPITSTKQLVEAIGQTQLWSSSSSSRRRGGGSSSSSRGIHPATRTFQALRIAVNDEILKLERALPAAVSCLSPGGRLAVISFHSLEDRLVKHAFMTAAGRPTPAQEALVHGPGGLRLLDELAAAAQGHSITRKPLLPGEAEVAANPRARSAKLRVFQKKGGPPPAPAAAAAGTAAAAAAARRRRRQQGGGDGAAAAAGAGGGAAAAGGEFHHAAQHR